MRSGDTAKDITKLTRLLILPTPGGTAAARSAHNPKGAGSSHASLPNFRS